MPPTHELDLVVDRVRAYLAQGAVEEAADLVASLRRTDAADLLEELHPADSADVLEEFSPVERAKLVDDLDPLIGADVLIELDDPERADVARRLDAETLSNLLDEMAADDAADVLGDLDAPQVEAALRGMDDREQQAEVRELLTHDEDSAGGVMSPHVLTFQQSVTVGETLAFLRRTKPDEETTYYLFVTDAAERLIGTVSLRQLVIAAPDTPLGAIMNAKLITAHVDDDQETVARTLARYDLLALPIVDDDQRLVGVVTADDVIDVLEEEATEDIYHLANLDADEDVYDSVWRSSRRRLMWLGLNLPTALLAGWVVSRFDTTIAAIPAMAAFLPIIGGQGGNAGIQTLTLVVRSLSLGEIALRDSWRTIGHELLIGIVNGLIFGFGIGMISLFWLGSPILGVIVGGAMLLNLIAAALAGALVPLGLRLLNIDPALASGVIVTTVTDVIGFFCLLGLATLILL